MICQYSKKNPTRRAKKPIKNRNFAPIIRHARPINQSGSGLHGRTEIMEQKPTNQQRVDEVIGRLCCLDDMRHVCPSRKGEGEPLLSNHSVRRIVDLARQLMFPGFYTESVENDSVLRSMMTLASRELYTLLVSQITAGLCFDTSNCEASMTAIHEEAHESAIQFIEALPSIRHILETSTPPTSATRLLCRPMRS